MRQLQLVDHLSDAMLKQMLQASRNTPEFVRWQILYLIQVENMGTADVIASLVGLSKPSVYSLVQKYNKEGPSSVALRPRGGRRRSLLTLQEETELMSLITDLAAQGLVKTVFDVKAHVEKAVGKTVSDDYLWDLFKRHGWKKKLSRALSSRKNASRAEGIPEKGQHGWRPQSGK